MPLAGGGNEPIMNSIRQILVPVDFSECSSAALEYAAGWAQKFDAAIDLLHVWQAPTFTAHGAVMDPALGDVRIFEIIRSQAEKQMDGLASEARARGIGVRSTRCTPGSAPLCIVEASGDYDLIVIGTHGRTGFSHFLLGSVAERVVQLAKCPVVTVRAPNRAAA